MKEASAGVIDRLVAELMRFPGIGRKTAQRLVFHLLKRPPEETEGLARALLAVREKAPFCLTATADKTVVTQGSKVTVALKVDRLWPDFKVPLQVTALDLIPNLTFNNNQPLTVAADKSEPPPALSASTVGLIGSPLGQGPLLATSAPSRFSRARLHFSS